MINISLLRILVAIAALYLTACAGTSQAPVEETTAKQISEVETADAEPKEVITRPFTDEGFHDLLVAEFAVRRNRFDLALGNYLQQAHTTRDKGVTQRATRLAQYLQADKATLDAAQLWVELEPKNVEAQYTLATILAKTDRPVEAIQHMAVVLEQGGRSNFSAIAAGSLSLSEEVRLDVENTVNQYLETYPKNTQLLTAKALLLQQRNELQSSLTTIREVLSLDETDISAVMVETRLLQLLKRDTEAYTRLESMLAKFPQNKRLRLQYARMLMATDVPKAQEQFEILHQQSPDDADLLLSLALINSEMNNPDEAESYFNQLLETGEHDSEAHLYLGELAEKSGDWQSAIEHYSHIELGSNFLPATNRVIILYLEQGQMDNARIHIAELRQRYPEHSIRLYLLESELLRRNDQFQQGLDLLTEALMISPQQTDLLYARSMLSEKLNNASLMEQDLQAIINQEPDNATALNALGYVLANRSERLDDAYTMIQQAIALKPDDPAIMDSLGWVEYRRGNLANALLMLDKAYKIFPDAEIAAHLGEVLWQSGLEQQAREIWHKALSAQPDRVIIQHTIERLNVQLPLISGDAPENGS
jgi:tetratricopeptide (TPR) repeat protein